jgi:hypothetical protein
MSSSDFIDWFVLTPFGWLAGLFIGTAIGLFGRDKFYERKIRNLERKIQELCSHQKH